MLNALTVSLDGDEAGRERAARSMARQGFAHATRLRWLGGTLDAWSNPAQSSVADCFVHASETSACSIGPIWYRGAFGVAALQRLLDEADDAAKIDETKLRGNFALFLRKGERAWLLNDAPGFVRLYASDDGRFHSTSWLAARAYVGSADVDEAAAIEYVLLGATHSNRSSAPGVSKLPLGHGLDLSARCIWRRFPHGIGVGGQCFSRIDEGVDSIASQLRTVFGEIAAAFPGKSAAALSGGFDSRLIVAGLLEQGERPRLFVYGGEASEDVLIAREVAQAENLDLEVIDKDKRDGDLPAPDLDTLVRNALFFDGLPNDGILDSGTDCSTRLEQCVDGAIVLNGGGGEIFRNFFHLADGRYRALDIVRAFYRGFDSSVFRRPDGLDRYEKGLAAAISRSVSADPSTPIDASTDQSELDRTLEREQIELVYPLFRCHHWMALNNSIALRYGNFGTPLVDLQLLRDACLLPLSWKNAGRFESRLIAALHSGIAGHQSSYGFRFSEGPGKHALWSEWINGKRPVFARPMINALGRTLRKSRASPSLVSHWRAVLPGEWRLDPALDLERLPDNDAFSRALAVEVVSRELAP